MKKQITLFILIFVMAGISFSQTITTNVPQLRNAVLEEFTGINCGYCPEGHEIAQTLKDDNPGRVVLINIHQGPFANASPDFTTEFGDALANQAGVAGYPTATVNRQVFPEVDNVEGLGRGAWVYAAHQIFPEATPVNIGFTTSFDDVSRELTIDVELFYTADVNVENNFLHIAFTESGISGPQAGTSGTYTHNYMLRHLITGQWGDTIAQPETGTLINKSFTYTVPAEYNVENSEIAVFVTETKEDIYTGVVGSASGTTVTGESVVYVGDVYAPETFFVETTPGTEEIFQLDAYNALMQEGNFKMVVTAEAPDNWNYLLQVEGNDYTDTANVTIPQTDSLSFNVAVTPGNTPGIGVYKIEMFSVEYPEAPARVSYVYVISGVTDLIVDGSGSFGDGESYDFHNVYLDALNQVTTTGVGYMPGGLLTKAFNQEALNQVQNIYLNVGWTFPSIDDDEALALIDFLENGGNLMIAGQDIGWDIMSGDGYGTSTTMNFYQNYLSASYTSDGSTTNNQIIPDTMDYVYKYIDASSSVVDAYNGNMYPDQIAPAGDAVAAWYYNTTHTKIAGIRNQTDTYKVLYLGIGLEMVQSEDMQHQIIESTYNWFHNHVYDANIMKTCQDECGGRISVLFDESQSVPYFTWENSEGYADSIAENLCAGRYYVTVVDTVNPDTAVMYYDVETFDAIEISMTSTDASDENTNDGSATAAVTGGSGNYEYLWNDTQAQTTATAENLIPGDYIVTVTDLDCGTVLSDTVTVEDASGIESVQNLHGVSTYPNPVKNQLYIENETSGQIKIQIYDITGNILIETISKGNKTIDMSTVSAGIYFIEISKEGKQYRKKFIKE